MKILWYDHNRIWYFVAYTLELNFSHIIKKLPNTCCATVAVIIVTFWLVLHLHRPQCKNYFESCFDLFWHNFSTSLWLENWRMTILVVFCPIYYRNLNTTGKFCLIYFQHYDWHSLNQMPLQHFFYMCITGHPCFALAWNGCSLGIAFLQNPSTFWPLER